MGFGVPIGKWFRGEMSGFVSDILLSEASLGRGLFEPAEIRRYVNSISRASLTTPPNYGRC
jgi:asparagine synthase (glutamine-hydrolysing)